VAPLVADENRQAGGARGFADAATIVQTVRDRLFHEHRRTPFQAIDGDRRMRGIRGGDDHAPGLELLEQSEVTREAGHARRAGHLGAARRRVRHADQFEERAVQCAVDMGLADQAGADDGDGQSVHGALSMRSRRGSRRPRHAAMLPDSRAQCSGALIHPPVKK
jgi:hypothetical protein